MNYKAVKSASPTGTGCSETACPMGDPAACPAASLCHPTAPLTLADALPRFEREAKRGVCDTGRYRCNYYAWGEGPPLLLVHGLSDDSLSFVQLAARLAPFFRCVAYDLPRGNGDGAR